MEQTLHALTGILLKAIPTVVFVVILHFYLKAMLFRPLTKVLKEREALTEGAKKSAAESLAEAERKTAEYEVKLRAARAEVYREQEETRRKWLDEQAAQVAQTRSAAEASVRKAKDEIAAEAEAARTNLSGTSATLADQIATAVLAGRRA
jgi:F-type H+-transporting ATPase subunit b